MDNTFLRRGCLGRGGKTFHNVVMIVTAEVFILLWGKGSARISFVLEKKKKNSPGIKFEHIGKFRSESITECKATCSPHHPAAEDVYV